MSRQAITVELPEEVYRHVKRAAEGMKRPVERVLASIVKGATPSLEKVPVEYRAELEGLETLGDDKLWKVAESAMPAERQRRLARLLLKTSGELTAREQERLARLRNEADRLTLHKSYAYLLLKYRGHRIPSLPEM
ncbi:MAG TPA: hypothetical protein VN687_18205 [Blastocatellia bacterium]|nr:hypothetical protein [Blastocatellia bacterium]